MTDRAKAYTDAGVNINAGNEFVSRIKSMVSSTFTGGVVTDIGGFGGLFKLDSSNMEEPVLVASTDGVGTKLNLAFQYNRHDTIGIDLVAMSVNDILVQGAKPLFFLDYFATGKLDVDTAENVLSGVVDGCKQGQCALLGGETAEMPDFYKPGEYDLSGFCVGVVDNANIVDGSSIRPGDKIIGLASSGVHSNGYSLVRKLVNKAGLKGDDPFPGTDRTAAEVLLEPTRIYVETVRNIIRDIDVKGMCHVTGGGFYDNIPRILPRGVVADINFGSWDILPVFFWLKEQGELSWPEMLQIFNCGIGYILIVSEDVAEDVMNRAQGMGEKAWMIGEIKNQKELDKEQVIVDFAQAR
ncbi:phosphoribosylformylglycinamidine cyclo-ligase [Desulfobaculum bizertense]|uniref:Phosphoribosylformylglycinamidine cyclo-ligase n=1 Tax=Desulfobaculum bizertense DSM 18034 TaxID=1121442 RepID=A0A1T4VVM5_9BACT|nr:phosphoribosylformylglycinamidine cyclo-ligase [Desulfobaculum bizertense]SKA69064.1 phosphoribosylformylglycinamidine cyclo-ligase [Desulfobaculum bizertense DSM 18034]